MRGPIRLQAPPDPREHLWQDEGWNDVLMNAVIPVSVPACPGCGDRSDLALPGGFPQVLQDRGAFGTVLPSQPGDCFLPRSRGSFARPPMQAGQGVCK